jgi:Putative zinc-finger
MNRHLNASTLDGYLERSLEPAELRALDEHVEGCLSCTLAVEASMLDVERWERRGVLGRLARVAPSPLVDADRVDRAA